MCALKYDINFSFLQAARKIPEERKEREREREGEGREGGGERERERERERETERERRRGEEALCRFIFPASRFVVENARLATTFSNDNNYPRETSLPIRRERLLFFIYGQAHYFCASKHMKNSPLARSSPLFPSPCLLSSLPRHLLAAATDPCNDRESRFY